MRNPTVGFEWEFKDPSLVEFRVSPQGTAVLSETAGVCQRRLIHTAGQQRVNEGGRLFPIVDITLDLFKGLTGVIEIITAPVRFNDDETWLKVHTFIAAFVQHAAAAAFTGPDGQICRIPLNPEQRPRVAPIARPQDPVCIVAIRDVFDRMVTDARLVGDYVPVLTQGSGPEVNCGLLMTRPNEPDSGFPQINIATKVEAWGLPGAVLDRFFLDLPFAAADAVAKDAYNLAQRHITDWLRSKPELAPFAASNFMRGLWTMLVTVLNAQAKATTSTPPLTGFHLKNAFNFYIKTPMNALFAKANEATDEGKAVRAYWARITAAGATALLDADAADLGDRMCSPKNPAGSCTPLFKSALTELFAPGRDGEGLFNRDLVIPAPVAPFMQDGRLCVLCETRTGAGALSLERSAELVFTPGARWTAKFKNYAELKDTIGALP